MIKNGYHAWAAIHRYVCVSAYSYIFTIYFYYIIFIIFYFRHIIVMYALLFMGILLNIVALKRYIKRKKKKFFF